MTPSCKRPIVLSCCYFVNSIIPESLRWLLVKQSNKEALETLKKVAKINRNALDDIQMPTIKEKSKTRLGDVKALFKFGYAKTTLVVWYAWYVDH
jgi:hypothetical protein